MFSKEQLETMAQAVPVWCHTIHLGHGVVTPGIMGSLPEMENRLATLRLPELSGKSVLDINTLDGFFAFAAERRGARRVVALDHYLWAMDMPQHLKYWSDCKEKGLRPRPYHEMPYYRPDQMPGLAGFDTARQALQSSVEGIAAEFMEMDLESLGKFDVVLYLGSLYHMENPLAALKRVAKVTEDLAIIETEATAFPGFEDHGVCEFFESNELNGDVSNWWAPNEKALTGMCRAAGFREVTTIVGSPLRDTSGSSNMEVIRYRAIVHARK
jgi:tRNA (mo5U34)-methyltransferase